MRYEVRGELPRKRHVAFRDNGTLLTEEVMGFEGFSGGEVDPLPPSDAVPGNGARPVRAAAV